MSAPLCSVEVDATRALAALNRLGAAAERYVDAVCAETAQRVAFGADARAARRSGRTASGLVVERSRDGRGYVVYVKLPSDIWQNLPAGLEFGTRKMTPQPFLFVAARLEEAPHLRRLADALEAAVAEVAGG